MKFTPFYDTLITTELKEEVKTENVSKGGLILMSNSASNMKPMLLKVEAVGPEAPKSIVAGTTLMAFPGTGAETTYNDVTYRIIRSKDVICQLEE